MDRKKYKTALIISDFGARLSLPKEVKVCVVIKIFDLRKRELD